MSFLLQADTFYCDFTKVLPLINLINIIAFEKRRLFGGSTPPKRYEIINFRHESTFADRLLK